MNGKNTLGIAAILLAVQLVAGITFACEDCSKVDFYNYVNTSGTTVHVFQNGVGDVSFTNNIEVRNGSLDFTQYVESYEWALTNKAYLEGTRVTFQGVTVGAVDCTNCTCGEIKYNQHIEVDGYLDPWAYQKLENANEGKVLEQMVEIVPGGWMRVDQSGHVCGLDCDYGYMAQSGWLHSPIGGNNIAWQAGTIDEDWGYNKVEAEWWLDFNQVVSFNMN